MVTKLDQYRVELPPAIVNNDEIKKYLHEQFQKRASQADLMPYPGLKYALKLF